MRLAGLGGFTDHPLPFYSTAQAKLPRRRTGRAADRPGDHIKVEWAFERWCGTKLGLKILGVPGLGALG